MRKAPLALGIIFLLVGILLVLYSQYPIEKVKERPLVNRAEKQWEVSGNLSKGQRILVAVVPSADWTIWAQEIFEPGFKVNVSIIIEDPLGNEAEFIIFYEPPPPTYEHENPDKPLPIFLSNPPFKLIKKGSLIVDEPLNFIGGVVTQNGTYKARVIPTWWTEGPPEYIEMYAEILGKEYPYANFLLVGVCLCILGVATIVALRTKYSKYKMRRAKLKSKGKRPPPSFKTKVKD